MAGIARNHELYILAYKPIKISNRPIRMLRLSLLAFVLSATAFANEVGNLPQVKKTANGQPEDVVEFIERTVECNHWAGEEPYDKERAEQIRKAIKNARCDGLVSEEQALKLKYKKDRNVLDAIKKAKDLNI